MCMYWSSNTQTHDSCQLNTSEEPTNPWIRQYRVAASLTVGFCCIKQLFLIVDLHQANLTPYSKYSKLCVAYGEGKFGSISIKYPKGGPAKNPQLWISSMSNKHDLVKEKFKSQHFSQHSAATHRSRLSRDLLMPGLNNLAWHESCVLHIFLRKSYYSLWQRTHPVKTATPYIKDTLTALW